MYTLSSALLAIGFLCVALHYRDRLKMWQAKRGIGKLNRIHHNKTKYK